MGKRLIYENRLSKPEDAVGFVPEGQADITFDNGAMLMRNALSEDLG